MKYKLEKLISNKIFIVSIYVILAITAGIQAVSLKKKDFKAGEPKFNSYNNYTIFEKSFEHLVNNEDIYKEFKEDHWDLYKYTPTFSVFFGIFHFLPDWLGLNLWNLVNVLVLLFSIYYLPKLNKLQKGGILLIVILELMTSIQNQQSNGLMAGLIIFSFGLLEKNKSFWATFCIVFSIFIKLFGGISFVLLLFYPNKLKSALYTTFWILVFLATPLLFISFEQNIYLYKSYLQLLSGDHAASYGYSLMGWLNVCFSLPINKNFVVIIGAIIFIIPFYRVKMYKEISFRILALCSLLLWIIVFNHKAESPTFIISMVGIVIWFMISKKNTINIVLFILAIIFTSLSTTDIFPVYLREKFMKPYLLKALPSIIIWFKIIYDMLVLKPNKHVEL